MLFFFNGNGGNSIRKESECKIYEAYTEERQTVETTPCTPQCKMYNDREKCPRNKNMISTEAKMDATEIGPLAWESNDCHSKNLKTNWCHFLQVQMS